MLKRISKISLIILITVMAFIFYEMTSISTKIVNRDFFSFDINNIRNPQIKKIMRYVDNYYASFLLRIDNSTKLYLINEDNRKNLPEIKIIKKTNKFSKNLFPTENNGADWLRNYAGHSSNRFSKLTEINKNNLNNLSVAWKYKIDEEVAYDIQSNAIVAENKIIIPSYNKKLICLDAITGQFLWELKLKDGSPRRGMIYKKKNKKNDSKIFFSSYKKLISVNVKDGKINKNFGKNGIVKLKKPSLTSPAIFENNLIITTSEPSVNVYDVNTGKFLWKYILMKNQLKKRNGGKRYDYSGGNPWGGFSLDEKRGIAYITTGNAGRYFNGVNRPGKNEYANSIIAIDIVNKKKIWDFQEVRHDIWNLDIPAPPILGSITKNNKKVDVVIALTKLGNTIVLDRVSGKPIFDFHLKKAPSSKLPGEKTNFYQPKLNLPEPFAKQEFNLNEVTNINNESKNYILRKIKNYNYGFFEPYEIGKKNIQFNFHGGAEWPGGSYDLKTETLFVTSSNIAWETEVVLNEKDNKYSPKPYYKYNSKFKRLLDKNGYPGSKPPWGTLTAINLNSGKIKWQKPFGEYEELTKKGIPVTGTENYSGVTGTESGILLATGTLDKKFRIFDSNNGKELWSYDLPYIGSSPPITYLVNNEQYILINSTGSFSLKKGYPNLVDFGNTIIAFKLNR
jgi:quinoprotein glucose dehydrogenase